MKKISILSIFIIGMLLIPHTPVFAIGEGAFSNEAGVLNRQYQDQLREQYIDKNIIDKTEEDLEREKKLLEKDNQDDKDVRTQENLTFNPQFKLNAVKFEGNTVISDKKLQKIAKKYIGQDIYLDELFDLTVKVSRYYQKQGYITSYAYIDKQEITDGVVTINIHESRVAAKDVEGNKWERPFYLKNIALGGRGLNEGSVFDARALQGAMKEINNSGYMKGSVEIGKDENQETKVKLHVEDRFPLRWDMAWDDFGRNYTGRQRWTNILGMDNLTGFGDKIYAGTILSQDSKGFIGGYEVPITKWGTKLSFDYSHTGINLGGPYRQYNIKGKANDYMLRLTHPIRNTATQEINVSVGFNWLNSRADSETLGNLSDYSLRVIRTNINGLFDDKHGRTIANFGVDVGIDGLGATPSISGVAESAFYKIIASLARVQRLPRECLAIFRLNGQYSGQSLYPAEQFYLGGAYSVRGYQASELIGDYGVGGSLEFRTPVPGIKALFPKKFEDNWARKVRFVTFYDWGYINSQNNNYDSPTNFIHSVGVGTNINFTDYLSMQIGIGFPLMRKLDEERGRLYFTVNTELDKLLLKPKARTQKL